MGCHATVEDKVTQYQPDEASEDERKHIADLDTELPGWGHDDGISALSPAQVGLLGLQVMYDSC